jgi:tetratricopeptide (TPR) repeat protein
VSYARCNQRENALSFYNKALRQNSKLCGARVGVGLDALDQGRDSNALREFQAAVKDDPQCTEGYVNLAALQRRGGDVKEALNNLRRALAIDAQYLPAFNEMALLYLQQAQDNKKMLDLAEVVCSQAQKINASYAPVYNTWGLIDLRRDEIIAAAAKFQRASELDPKIFEAHMNFGQITIGFRGYEDAKKSFTQALSLQPKDYDAMVGLGVALRGLDQTDKAEEMYNKAKGLQANRPESYYNLGVLYQDFKDGTTDQMKTARSYYEQFMTRAGSDPRYAAAVEEIKRRCKYDGKGKKGRGSVKCIAGRLQNIEDYLQAMKDMAEIERLQKQAEKQQKEVEAQQQQQEQAAPPSPAPSEAPAGEAPAPAPAAPAAGGGEAPAAAPASGKKK